MSREERVKKALEDQIKQRVAKTNSEMYSHLVDMVEKHGTRNKHNDLVFHKMAKKVVPDSYIKKQLIQSEKRLEQLVSFIKGGQTSLAVKIMLWEIVILNKIFVDIPRWIRYQITFFGFRVKKVVVDKFTIKMYVYHWHKLVSTTIWTA